MEQTQQPSVYQRGAVDGLPMGLLMSVIFLMQALLRGSVMVTLVSDVLMLAVPVVAYYYVRRGYRADSYATPFSGLWMHGIMIFLCGSLIMGLVMFLYMRFVEPAYITATARSVVDLYEAVGTPEAEHVAETIEKVIDQRLLPSPIMLAFTAIWAGGFTGAIASLIIAFIVKRFNTPRQWTSQ